MNSDRNASVAEIIENQKSLTAEIDAVEIRDGIIWTRHASTGLWGDVGPVTDWFVDADGEIYWSPESWT